LEEKGVRPYGISLYAFSAQFANELSFSEGEVVYLLEHVDREWIKGEVDGRRGIFPADFINIVVDCPGPAVPEVLETQAVLQEGAFAKAAFAFEAHVQGDVSVDAAEVVFVLSVSQDGQWATVKKQDGITGVHIFYSILSTNVSLFLSIKESFGRVIRKGFRVNL